ncbi:MAG: Lrp/AsnC family transcriptional regulator [Sphaerochaetaceae bacterium]|jgi:Lrp/AsnC family transcriptional regulator for asnA, asnC and gidA
MIKKIDETNKAIIRKLADGRKPFSSIAEELSITENTVRARVNKLIEEGVLCISGLIDPEQVPGLQVVMMGVKLKTMELGRKAEEFSRLRGVISAVVVTGRYDLIVQAILSEEEGLSLPHFFNRELAKISEILEVETFVVYQSYNYRVPFIL